MPIDFKTTKDPFEYHRDYPINHRWAKKWIEERESSFPLYSEDPNDPKKRVYGMFVKLRGSEHFKESLLAFELSLPPSCPDKQCYANLVNLNQDNSEFQRVTIKTYDVMRVLLNGKMAKTTLKPVVKGVSFDNVPQSLKEITYGIERFKYKEAV